MRFIIILSVLMFSSLAHSENVEGNYQTEANEDQRNKFENQVSKDH